MIRRTRGVIDGMRLRLVGLALVAVGINTMMLAAPAWSQSEYSYEAVAIPVFEPGDEGAYDVDQGASIIRGCKTCTMSLTMYFRTSSPGRIGTPITPVADPYDTAVITVDTSPRPTGVWGSIDGSTPAVAVEWRITMDNVGQTTLQPRDPVTNTVTTPWEYHIYEIKKIIARYKLTTPTDSAVSPSWHNNELNAFWVVDKDQYKCEVRLEAQFGPENIVPGCFMWEFHWKGPDGQYYYSPGSAEFLDARDAITRMAIYRPGTYRVRGKCRDHYRQVTVNAVHVTKVEWVQHTNPVLNNPGSGLPGDPGVGKRIFTGTAQPGLSADNACKISVRATIEPPIALVAVHFKLLDVDDPSWNAGVVDGDKRGNDNLGSPARGNPWWMWDKTDSNGHAIRTTRLPRRPGDNFVCGAAVTSDSGRRIGRDTSIYIEDEADTRLDADHPTPVAAASPLLTIWRYAHFEVDRMSKVTDNWRRRRVHSVLPLTDTKSQVRFGSRINDAWGHLKRFENGKMIEDEEFIRWRVFDIITNDKYTVTVTHPEGEGNRPRAGVRVELIDDDKQWGSLPMPDTSLLKGVLRQCYIEPKFDLPKGTAPFAANCEKYDGMSIRDLPDYYSFDSKNYRRSTYWANYLLGAYQYGMDRDLDPGTESGSVGTVDSLRGLGAVMFSETMLDRLATDEGWAGFEFDDVWKYTTAQQALRLWAAGASDGGFMAGPEHMSEPLAPLSVYRIRRTDLP